MQRVLDRQADRTVNLVRQGRARARRLSTPNFGGSGLEEDSVVPLRRARSPIGSPR